MSAESRIASVYAKSVVTLAQERGSLEEIKADAETVKQSCEESRELRLFLKSPIIKSSKKSDVLNAVFKANVSELMLQFLQIVCMKGRSQFVFSISKEIIKAYNKIKGIQEASVVSAVKLTDTELNSMENLVKKYSGKSEVTLRTEIDEEIIGGFILNIGDKQIDESVESKLRDLSVQFSK